MALADRLHFVDWMKAIGIVLIVYGHLAGSTIDFLLPPILPKQIGVSCFFFVLAFVLAREHRDIVQIVINRLFSLYIVGIAFALVLSGWGALTTGQLQLSNYLPFLVGANVLLLQNAFPANPTTWYIGTYVHVVLLWALFGRFLSVRLWMIGCIAAGEVGMRIFLADAAGPFTAYTALFNWLTVLFWGTWLGQRSQQTAFGTISWRGVWSAAMVLLLLLVAWPTFGAGLHAYGGFPFEVIGTDAPWGITIFASLMVTLLYVSYADCFFRLTQGIRAPAVVQFLARNTLLIFIAHMPVFYVVGPILETRFNFWQAKSAELLICLVGIGFVSEGIFRCVNIAALRDRLFSPGTLSHLHRKDRDTLLAQSRGQ